MRCAGYASRAPRCSSSPATSRPPETFRWLEDHGVDAIRVGIAGGSVCETRTETGVHAPTPYSVYECVAGAPRTR